MINLRRLVPHPPHGARTVRRYNKSLKHVRIHIPQFTFCSLHFTYISPEHPTPPMPLNKYSGQITQPATQGSSQAMLYATGMSEDDMNKPQVGIASMWFEGNPCNMHLLGPRRRSEEGRAGGRARRHAVQHDRRLRRHLDGHRRHELLAPIARPHRRLDRNRDVRPVVRCVHRASRLRQEHARLADGARPAQSARLHGLRRHDSRRPHRRRASRSTSSPRSRATARSSWAR